MEYTVFVSWNGISRLTQILESEAGKFMTKYTTLSEELNALPKEQQELIEIRASQIRLEEIILRHLHLKLSDFHYSSSELNNDSKS